MSINFKGTIDKDKNQMYNNCENKTVGAEPYPYTYKLRKERKKKNKSMNVGVAPQGDPKKQKGITLIALIITIIILLILAMVTKCNQLTKKARTVLGFDLEWVMV